MAFLHIPDVRLAGVAACVPKAILETSRYAGFSKDEAEKFISSTGVERRRIADENITTSDLCLKAAEKLISDLNWSRDEIDCLIFVTQTPDYILPATSCLLQDRLKLKEGVFALDISLGCSGWIYGLQVITSMLSHGQLKKGLLLVGDTILKPCSPGDKSTYPLFGDAGTATALEYNRTVSGFKFHTATDGTGFEAIIIPDGGYRNGTHLSSFEMIEFEPGIKRNRLQTVLDGMSVFSFGISKAPESIRLLTENYGIDLEQVDYFLFHQANLFMNEKIRKKLKIPSEKVPYSIKNYGNTSSATIPLTIVTEIKDVIANSSKNLVACGFGVGLSWGTVQFFTDRVICSDLIEY
ncbi:MAG: ketoacyl-ACP synthase III [Bacteroidales bacterium]|nr:ketoacyl-ACP synthase III [Bacteroidales bacterium]